MRRLMGLVFFLLLLGSCPARAALQINEILASNGIYQNGHAYEWIEIKNTGDKKVSLAGAKLTFTRKKETQTYTFPEGSTLAAGGYAVVYCVENDPIPARSKNFYANISLSKKGGTVTLLSKKGKALDTVELGAQFGNVSWGRVKDGGKWRFLSAVSPGKTNASAGYAKRAEAPAFSASGGFYKKAGKVKLAAEKDAQIRYTLDGSEPTAKSTLYTGAISYKKGVTCIRAKAFYKGRLPSETVTQTFFVGVDRPVPIVSLVTDAKYLTDSKTGLLVPGNGKVKNYERDWEYPISVEYYGTDGQQQINQIATFRVTGATSRKYGQKTLSLFARGAYGHSRFTFNPFANRKGYTGYKALTLRCGGTESYLTRFRDAMLTARAAKLNIAYQESVTVLVYLNGQYWGQYNLRERVNKYFLAQFEGITNEKTIDGVNIIKGRGEVQKGSIDGWQELINFCKTKDLNVAANLKWVEDRLDIDNFFTHTAIEMIVGNTDIGNIRYYQFPGGKWKCVLYDLDASMKNLIKGPITYYNKSVAKRSMLFYHEPFAALIRVPAMKERFFTILGQTILQYLPRDLTKDVDKWVKKLEPLMTAQIARWPKCSPKTMAVWQYEVKQLRKICQQRPGKVIDMACSTYGVSEADKQRYFADYYKAVGK